MDNSIIKTLLTCGFSTPDAINADIDGCACAWGRGSWASHGTLVTVTILGGDMYEIRFHEWFYCGDEEYDKQETIALHGARALQYIFERVPLWDRRR